MTMVLKAIEPIWKTKTETASRVRGRIEAVLDFAKVRGYRDGANPAVWSGHLEHALPAPGNVREEEHHPALPYAELPAFWQHLRRREGIPAKALAFLILTGTRGGAVRGARWNEIDLKAKVWTVPVSRAGTKLTKDHRVPLCAEAIAILNELPQDEAFVFIGGKQGKPISDASMSKVIKGMHAAELKAGRPGYLDQQENNRVVVPHGFRSTFKDWASERTAYANIVSEMALSHVIDNKVESAYRRGDLFVKRSKLMNDWATYCTTPRPTADVTPIRHKAA